ncbi:branched-chain amino acid ABC transporter substrate-binding protein [uncultured Jatrophihabitans sp.]|uniref:branched-chain amino acid ABC transporter substrate-binding protein n=1 Tax=uncultured Jatrophihabitans sp. TaxID=1610747 RepID=UPI0035C9A6A2
MTSAVALAAAGALALTGCGSSGGGSKKSGGLGGGGGSSSSAAGGGGATSGKTYKIGFQGALSGDNKQLGINEVNAFNLAIQQANSSGKYNFKIAGEPSDDGGTNNQAPAAAAKLIQDASVLGVVGPAFSGPTTATGAKYAQASMALISPSATNETLTKSGYTTFHRIVPTDGVEGLATADYLAKKFKTVFVVDDKSTYGAGVGDVVRAELKKKGVKVSSQGIAPTSDYSAIAQTVKSSGDQAMYYAGYDAQAGLLAKALKAVSYTGFEISGNGGKSSIFTSTAGSAGNGYYFACGCLDAVTAPAAAAFTKAYQAKYNTPPSTYSPEAYDATNALITAIATAAKSGTPTRQSVESAVNGLNYQGITTTVKFQKSGEVAQATVNLYEQKNGKIDLLGDITQQK